MTDQKPSLTIPIGPQHADEAHKKACLDGLSKIVAVLNDLPDGAMLPVLCSVLMTVCANQVDPIPVFEVIGLNVAIGLKNVANMPAGHA